MQTQLVEAASRGRGAPSPGIFPRRVVDLELNKDTIDQSLAHRALVVALALAVRRVDASETGVEGLRHEFGRSVALVRRRINQLGHWDERAVRRRHFKKGRRASMRCPSHHVVQIHGVDGVQQKQEC